MNHPASTTDKKTQHHAAAHGHSHPPGHKPDEPKKKGGLDAYVLMFLGLLLFVIGGHFNNAPLQGQHKLLAATSAMPMKELQKTIVFILSHNRGNTFGIVINRPGAKGAPGYGGPQEPDKLYALHSLDVQLPETQVMEDAGLGYVQGKEGVERLKGAKTKPSWYIIVHGYAGWGAGQMEQEIQDGSWELVEFDKDAVISTPPAKLWEAAKKMPKIQMTH